MTWTQQQCENVFNDFWRSGRSQCPNDQSVINFNLYPSIDGQYTLSGSCPRCGDGIQMNRAQDPLAQSFRLWTDAERGQLVNAHFQQRSAICPVCRSPVNLQSHPHMNGNLVSMRCIRCGNSYQQDFPTRS
jgi:ribosomal protein S27AE